MTFPDNNFNIRFESMRNGNMNNFDAQFQDAQNNFLTKFQDAQNSFDNFDQEFYVPKKFAIEYTASL